VISNTKKTTVIVQPGKVKRSFSYQRKEQYSGYWFIFPAAFTMLLLICYPLVYGIYISFFNTNLINHWQFVGLKYYEQAITNPDFLSKIWLTFKFAILVVAGNLIIGTTLAIILNMKLKGRLLFRAILILPWLFPDVVVGLLWKWLYNPMYGLFNHLLTQFHLTNTPIAWLDNPNVALYAVIAACIWKGYPLSMILILAGLQSISKDLYEASEIDGCTKWKSFRYVTIPGLMPVLMVTVILETVWWFKHFTTVWLLTAGGPVNATDVISIDIYKTAFQDFRWGPAAATSVIVFIICLLISAIYRRLLKYDE
jgi:multiple sugar transport system permease protein